MNNVDVLKQQLIEEQKVLHKELVGLGVQNISAPEDWIATPEEPAVAEADENIVADRKEDWIERRSEVAAIETRYNNVVKALTKIQAGEYGACEICNEPIEADRLTANPAARTCKTHLEDESQLTS